MARSAGQAIVAAALAILAFVGRPTLSGLASAADEGVWVPVSADDAPAPRLGPVAVWTGSQVLIWGGVSAEPGRDCGPGRNECRDGAAYNPTTGSWQLIPPAPIPRPESSAVWTGTEMVVFGGQSGSNYLGGGEAFDPVAETWRGLSADGAPSARRGHATAWTGTEMLVWGGSGNRDEELGDGAAYNPETDTWRPLPAAGAPTARILPAAVGSCDALFIWGGVSRSAAPIGIRGDGALYVPPGSAAPEPSPVTGGGASSAASK